MQFFYAVPNLLARIRAATRAVHTEHNGFHLLVLLDLFHLLEDVLGCNAVTVIRHNRSFGIEHGYAVFALGFSALDLRELGGTQQFVVIRAAHHTQHFVHIIAVDEGIHKVKRYELIIVLKIHIFVGIAIEVRFTYTACGTYCLTVLVPYTLQIQHRLLAVCLGHRGSEVRLYGTLVCAYFQYLHLYAQFVH